MTAEEERAAIVAWLRDDAGKTRQELSRLHSMRALTRSQTAEWEMLIGLKLGLANAIERRDHLSKGSE